MGAFLFLPQSVPAPQNHRHLYLGWITQRRNAVLKVSEEEYEKLDQQYLIKIRKEAYGYRCLTNQKQFYMENYLDVVIENGKIDDLVVMMEEQV